MGAYRLNTFVHAVELDGAGKQTGRAATFGPGDQVPDWALAAISNRDVWDGDAPPLLAAPAAAPADSDQSGELARLRARIAELESSAASGASPAATSDDGTVPASATVVPPRGGPGSGAPEWREYARSQGVEVAEGASRDDVIVALEAAGKPTK